MVARLFSVSGLLILFSALAGNSASAIPPAKVYESYSDYIQCTSGTFSCRVNFAKTPSTSRVLMRNVTCYIQSNQPLRLVALGLAGSTSDFFIKQVFVPFTSYSAGTTYYYSINAPVYFYSGPDRYPALSISYMNASSSLVQCSVAGDIESP